MPRYFIDTTDGSFHARDEEGSELADVEAARQEAMAALPEIASCTLSKGGKGPVVVEVRDEQGTVLFQAALTLSEQWMGVPPAGELAA